MILSCFSHYLWINPRYENIIHVILDWCEQQDEMFFVDGVKLPEQLLLGTRIRSVERGICSIALRYVMLCYDVSDVI